MADPYGFNLGDMLNGKGVDYNAVPLDQGTIGVINANAGHALQGQDALAAEHNAGIVGAGPGGQGLQSDQQMQSQGAATGQDPAMLRAIRNQYGQQAQKGINTIVKQNQINAPLTQGNELHQAGMMAQAQQNVATQNYEALTDAYNQNMAARAQVISSVFNVMGAGGGMAMNGQFKKPGQSGGGQGQGQQNYNNFNTGGGDENFAGNIA